MARDLELDDVLGGHAEDDGAGPQLLSFKDEMRQMPRMHRITIYLSITCMVLLFVQCLFIMPVILIKYGWGFSVN